MAVDKGIRGIENILVADLFRTSSQERAIWYFDRYPVIRCKPFKSDQDMKKIVKAVEKRKQEFGGLGGVAGYGVPARAGHLADLEISRVSLQEDVLRKNKVLFGDQMESATMAYNMLRTQVYKKMTSNGWTSLAVTSANKGEGKSLTALNLALSLSRSVQQTVVLVDLDLRRPSIHKKLNISPTYGMSDYFKGGAPLGSVMFKPEQSNLVVLPGRESLDNASELLASPRAAQLFSELKNHFPSRIVVLDLPPILLVDDVMVIADYVDCSLLVVSEGNTKKEELHQATELLEGTNVLGTLLNNSRSSISGGSYDYYYGSDD